MTALASRAQLRMSFLRYALFTVPAILLLGTLSGRASQSGYGNPWFDALDKPSFMPPGWAFPVAWTILYILLGLSLAMILHARGARGRGLPVVLFLVQMVLNYAWSPAFFAFHRVGLAFALVVGMILLTLACAFLFARIRKTAALLLIPYLAWLCFAGALTWQIRALNPDYLAQPGASADIAL
jgi:benzodiazapine receptor